MPEKAKKPEWKPGQRKEHPKICPFSCKLSEVENEKVIRFLNKQRKKHGESYGKADLLLELIKFADDNIFF